MTHKGCDRYIVPLRFIVQIIDLLVFLFEKDIDVTLEEFVLTK